MENVMIAILNSYDKVLAFMDNEAPDALHYYDDELHTYIKGSAATFGFCASVKHEDAQYLVEGNKLSFIYGGRDYYFNIMQVVKDEFTVEITAFSLSFELLNDEKEEFKTSKHTSFEDYVKLFDNGKMVEIGINELSTVVNLPGDFKQETLLSRMFSLAELFNAELEFVPVLANNYSLEKLVMNVYREHDDRHQGIGKDRRDIVLRYGGDVTGIKKTSDITGLFTAIRPTGKDGLDIMSLNLDVKDGDGNIEYFTKTDSPDIFAVQAKERFPSLRTRKDGYIRVLREYDTSDRQILWFKALHDLQDGCVPQVTYDIEGSFDVDIGDTVSVEDEEYNPALYLSARVTEQVISFTDPAKNKCTFSNVKEVQSQISADTIKRMQEMINANKTYQCSIVTDNGIVFKNGEGSTTLTASVMDGGNDVTDEFTVIWYKNGEQITESGSITVNAADIDGKAVYRYEAFRDGVVKGQYECTVINVSDGEQGEQGDRGAGVYACEIQTYGASTSIIYYNDILALEPDAVLSLAGGDLIMTNHMSGNTVSGNDVYRITAVSKSSFNVEYLYTIGKDGVNGVDGTIYEVRPTVQQIIKDSSGALNPSAMTFYFYKKEGDGEPESLGLDGNNTSAEIAYSNDGTNWNTTIQNIAGGYYYYTVPTYADYIRCIIRKNTSEVARCVIPVISDGADGKDGSVWYSGTAVTGTSTTGTVFSGSGIEYAHVNDRYLNTSTGYAYKCTVEGDADTAKWIYTNSLKGATGPTGTSGYLYRMILSALAIKKDASGNYSQSTITLQGKRSIGSGSPAAYAGRFKIETTTSSNLSSATWTSRYTSTSNVSSYTYTIPSGITGIRCSMYLAGGTTTLLDQVIIPVVSDGANGADADITPTLLASSKTLSAGSSFTVSGVKNLLLLEIANSSERSRKVELFVKGVSAKRYVHVAYSGATSLFLTIEVTWSGTTATIKCSRFYAEGDWSSGTSQLCYVYTI